MKNGVAAIDFGTSNIVTLVAENSGSQRCDIIAAGVAKYDGYLEGGWNNPGQLDEAIRRSISDAEEQANSKIREINVGVPGAFTNVLATKVTISLKGTDPRVTSADVKAAFSKAAENLTNIPGVVVHSSPAWFMVDNGKKTLEEVALMMVKNAWDGMLASHFMERNMTMATRKLAFSVCSMLRTGY